jgi:glycosyltransferase involved in cell wall biosynthesis
MNRKSQPLVSIVTPVYNGEAFLAECMESVLAQTYENWEYIIVNNRSTDGTLEIAKGYAEKDARVRVHTNDDFVAVIRNHNIAFRQMAPDSQYCKVLQADDWLFPDCIERMVAVGESSPKIGIIGSYGLYGNKLTSDGIALESSVLPGREVARQTLLGEIYPFGSPTSLLIRSDIIRGRDPHYKEPYLHADVEACYEVLKSYDFGFVHQVLTFVREHEQSETAKAATKFSWLSLSNIDLLKKFGPEYLSREEYEERLKVRMGEYYKFLGKSIFYFRDKSFWEQNKKECEKIGIPFSYLKTAGASFRELMTLILNPISSFQKVLRRISPSSS